MNRDRKREPDPAGEVPHYPPLDEEHVPNFENTPLTPGQAMRAIDMARGLDPQSALRAARMALESGDLHEAKRAKLEALVAELGGQAALEVEPEGEPAALEEPVTPWDDDGAIRSPFCWCRQPEIR